jgi:hypothetical protein
LLDNFQWIRDAAGPEGIPDAINLIAEFASKHGFPNISPPEQQAKDLAR